MRFLHGGQRLRRELLFQEGADIFGADGLVVDQPGQRVHVAVQINQHIGAITRGEHVATFAQGMDERAGIIALLPGLGDLPFVIIQGEARALQLRPLVERELPHIAGFLITGRQAQAVVTGKAPGHPHQLVAVEGQVDGLLMVGVDPRPDDVAVLTTIFDMKHDGARLVAQPQRFFCTADVIHVLVAGERPARDRG